MKVKLAFALVGLQIGALLVHGDLEKVEMEQYKYQGAAAFPGFSYNFGNPYGVAIGSCAPSLKWKRIDLSNNGFGANPAVDKDNNVYLGGSDGFLRKLSADGTLLWEVDLCSLKGEPAEVCAGAKELWAFTYLPMNVLVGKDDTVFTVGFRSAFKFDKDGNLLWINVNVPINAFTSPALDHRGDFVFSSGIRVGKLDGATGELVQSILLNTPTSTFTNVAIASNGDILVVGYNADADEGRLTRIQARARKPWVVDWQRVVSNHATALYGHPSGIAIDPCDNIVVTARDGFVNKFDRHGNNLWSITDLVQDDKRHIQAKPVIDASGNIYVQLYLNSRMVKLNPDGQVLWTAPTPGGMKGAPCLGSDGTLIGGFGGHGIFTFDTETGAFVGAYKARTGIAGTPVLGTDGTLYVVDGGSGTIKGGTLYALEHCPENPLHDPSPMTPQQCPED